MAVTVDAGRCRTLASLALPTITADGDGGYTETPPVPLSPATWRCAIEDPSRIRGGESARANTVVADATHVLRGRFHAGITTKTIVTWTDRAGATHTAHVLDARDTEGAGIESVLFVAEMPVP